jgi:DNA repair exonuclease SbcCD nuclease subunit
MRFIHTADWQIGKVFKQHGDRESVLQVARLDTIETIGQLAQSESIEHVLAAGDIYDTDSPSPNTLRGPLERMRRFPNIHWHLLPGNHDPHRPNGVWDRALAIGLPANVHAHLERVAFDMAPGVALLPCPLLRKTEVNDMTSWIDTVVTPDGTLRIGLAHGSVTGFGSSGDANNPIDPLRPEKAGLGYLALGDWHRTQKVSPAVWYSGTPEPDLVDSQQDGKVLIVELSGVGAHPIVIEKIVGRYRWQSLEDTLGGDEDLPIFEARLRALPDPSRTLLRLVVRGTLSLAGYADYEERLKGIGASFFSLSVKQDELTTVPTTADLESIDFDGVLSQVAHRLKSQAGDLSLALEDRQIAEKALVQLYTFVTRSARDARS